MARGLLFAAAAAVVAATEPSSGPWPAAALAAAQRWQERLASSGRSGVPVVPTSRVLPSAAIETGVHAPPAPVVAQGGITTGYVSVLDHGAKAGDEGFDNTQAFQDALNSLGSTGGNVIVPPGTFHFKGSLVFPAGVSLSGSYLGVPSHNGPFDGTVLAPHGGRGDANGQPFMTVGHNANVRGLVVFYPDNKPDQAPSPYPWTIWLSGDNAGVQDVELLNVWNGINTTHSGRFYISRVQGQPASIGIYVDQMYDIGRIDSVHWNPWFSPKPAYMAYQAVYGRGFVFARADWIYAVNTFVFGMAVGYEFLSSPQGATNGQLLGPGADCCANASVRVEDIQPYGLAIVNGEFTSFSGGFGPDIADHAQIVVEATTKGAVKVTNSAFWGPSYNVARVDGGSVSFEACVFSEWDHKQVNASAISVGPGASVIVHGSDFQKNPRSRTAPPIHVQLAAGAHKAIISDNIVLGPLVVVNGGAQRVIIHDNADDGWGADTIVV